MSGLSYCPNCRQSKAPECMARTGSQARCKVCVAKIAAHAQKHPDVPRNRKMTRGGLRYLDRLARKIP